MDLLLKRIAKRETYTIGKLYINGQYFCDTIEDKDRGVNNKMLFVSLGNGEGYWIVDSKTKIKKVYSQTAIPTGTYKIDMHTKSQKYSNNKYTWARPYKGYLPRLEAVPGFEGVLIHPGTDQNSTAGCLIVGQNKIVGKVINSQATFHKLMEILTKIEDDIFITII